MNSPRKKPKVEVRAGSSEAHGNVKPKVYFVPERIQKKRLGIMQNCAKSIGFEVLEVFDNTITHVISDFDQEQQVISALKLDMDTWKSVYNAQIVNTKWFTDSAKLKKPLPISREYCLEPLKIPTKPKLTPNKTEEWKTSYICQRPAMLNHNNKLFTDALDVLATEAELRDTESSYTRSLAFRKASAVLKSLPFKVSQIQDVSNLKDIGDHSFNVIREVLELGYSKEVNSIKNTEWFKTMQLFTMIYGVGPSTANKWYEKGLRTMDEVENLLSEASIRHDKRVEYGVAFFGDLSASLTEHEAQTIVQIIKEHANDILPGVIIEVTGGFRRGKSCGHDVDLLVTHPTRGKEKGFLEQLYHRLKSHSYILHATFEQAKSEERMLFLSKNNTMDNYEKCFCIFKSPKHEGATLDPHPTRDDFHSLCIVAAEERNWRARRVDIIISPISQFAYALVGWTGNKQFNRSLRHYAKKELNMKLTSHGLFHAETGEWLKADTEEEIFRHLKLGFLHPHERNP